LYLKFTILNYLLNGLGEASFSSGNEGVGSLQVISNKMLRFTDFEGLTPSFPLEVSKKLVDEVFHLIFYVKL
jgi:hypothetical protein